MTSTPLTIREYAYFNVTGPGTHETITELLGLRPSEAWNVGDINPRNGKPRKFMSWCLNSGLDDTKPLNMHIENLFLYLHTKADALRALWVEYDLTLVCTGHFPPSGHGMHFNREQIRQAAQLGLAFDLDFYYVDDHENDV
ncbi:DUF4279 domain-containing protein [Undibacterium sp.]|jgi:hypothetical protein|uniref:DUF4279 domain-containing protein n=1 Tax=Undibacterium sp. TaxID=1914977 RepID=UPI0025FFCA4D|nr:DUF4279 domain-containing protein [Undibacterium sp.]